MKAFVFDPMCHWSSTLISSDPPSLRLPAVPTARKPWASTTAPPRPGAPPVEASSPSNSAGSSCSTSLPASALAGPIAAVPIRAAIADRRVHSPRIRATCAQFSLRERLNFGRCGELWCVDQNGRRLRRANVRLGSILLKKSGHREFRASCANFRRSLPS